MADPQDLRHYCVYLILIWKLALNSATSSGLISLFISSTLGFPSLDAELSYISQNYCVLSVKWGRMGFECILLGQLSLSHWLGTNQWLFTNQIILFNAVAQVALGFIDTLLKTTQLHEEKGQRGHFLSWTNHDGFSVPFGGMCEWEGGCQVDIYTTCDSIKELDTFHK